jgi:hypothetical protein
MSAFSKTPSRLMRFVPAAWSDKAAGRAERMMPRAFDRLVDLCQRSTKRAQRGAALTGRMMEEARADPALALKLELQHSRYLKLLRGSDDAAETVFSGHGTYDTQSGMVVVPPGTSLTVYARHDATITDELGNAIELGADLSHVRQRRYGPGDKMYNYTLRPPAGLKIHGAPKTVSRPMRLSQLLKPGMGDCHWAACTRVDGSTSDRIVHGLDGIRNDATQQWITLYTRNER